MGIGEIKVTQWRQAVRTHIRKMVDESVLDTVEIKTKGMDYGNKMGIMCGMRILTETVSTVKWPSNWIEAFKERWFPVWLKKYCRVKYSTVDVKAIYPKCSLSDPILKASGNN